jgi:hypothetical protein
MLPTQRMAKACCHGAALAAQGNAQTPKQALALTRPSCSDGCSVLQSKKGGKGGCCTQPGGRQPGGTLCWELYQAPHLAASACALARGSGSGRSIASACASANNAACLSAGAMRWSLELAWPPGGASQAGCKGAVAAAAPGPATVAAAAAAAAAASAAVLLGAAGAAAPDAPAVLLPAASARQSTPSKLSAATSKSAPAAGRQACW